MEDKKYLDCVKRCLSDKRLTDEMRNELKRYEAECRVNKRLRIASVSVYLRTLVFFGWFLNEKSKRSFSQATKRDVEEYIAEPYPKGNKKSDSLINMIKLSLKIFYKWQTGRRKRGDYPAIVDWLSLKKPKVRLIEPEDCMTSEDFLTILNNCRTQKDRTFLQVVYETGARVSEILALTLEDVIFNHTGVYINIRESKTEPRRIYLFDSIKDLHLWVNTHPYRGDPQAPLFPSDRGKKFWLYEDARSFLHRLVKRAKIKKHIHFHLFRHSRVSMDAKKGMPLPIALKKFGWAKGSPMYSRYAHVSDEDVAMWDSQTRGIAEKKEYNEQQSWRCARCDTLNSWHIQFCDVCGQGKNENAISERELFLENLGIAIQELKREVSELKHRI